MKDDKIPAAKDHVYKWSDDETRNFIRLRVLYEHLFTGKRNAARQGWEVVLKEMGLLEHISVSQASKKWENLKKKYKEIKAGTVTSNEESSTPHWQWFNEMEEALRNSSSLSPPVLFASADITEAAASTSFPTQQPYAPYNPTQNSLISEPQRKKRRIVKSSNEILDFLRQQAEKEDQRAAEAEKRSERFLDLFSKLIDKL